MSRCISVDPYRRHEHIYGVFIALAWLYPKVIAEKLLVTFHDLKWLRGHEEGQRVAIFRFRVLSLPVGCNKIVECLDLKRFRLKEASFNFLPWHMMDRSQNWPNLRSPKWKFRDIHFRYCYGYQSLKVSRLSVTRRGYDEHSNFCWGEDTWRDLVTWPWTTWVCNLHTKMY